MSSQKHNQDLDLNDQSFFTLPDELDDTEELVPARVAKKEKKEVAMRIKRKYAKREDE